MNIAVIPARGGSKRIPRKNIKLFCGRPLIAYSIITAVESAAFNRVLVSTDDEEIADVARLFGAEVPFLRSNELADDHTSSMVVVKDVIERLRASGVAVTRACQIYPTAPLLAPTLLAEGFRRLVEAGAAFALGVTSFPFPIQRAVRIGAQDRIDAIWPEHAATRSQDLEPAFHDAGQFCWGTAEAFAGRQPVFSTNTVAVRIPRHLVQDIDTEEDWCRAELMYRVLKSGELDGV